MSGQAHALAEASVPYLPSWIARHQLERLADDAGLKLTLTQWPLPAAAVRQALMALPPAMAPGLADARNEIEAELDALNDAEGVIRWRTRSEGLAGFNDDETPGSSIEVRTPVGRLGELTQPWLVAHAGVRAQQPAGSMLASSTVDRDAPAAQLRLDASALVTATYGVNVQAFAHRSWWGPGWQDSLILGSNAPAWMGVGLQRSQGIASQSPWLAWLGPWNGEFFVARAQDPKVVAGQPTGYLFIGWRLSIKPHPNVEFALSRTEQTDGSGRPGGFGNFLRALTGAGTNADTAAAQSRDPGNEMAGFDLRVRCPRPLRCAGYTQLIGEDQTGILPSHYLGLFGLQTWTADGGQRFFVEYLNSFCGGLPGDQRLPGCAYRNYQYPQGYTNGTRWIGASAGPDSRIASLGWLDAASERRLRVHWGHVGVSMGSYAPSRSQAPHGALLGANIDQSFHWRGTTLTAEAAWARLGQGQSVDVNRRTNIRIGFSLSRSLW